MKTKVSLFALLAASILIIVIIGFKQFTLNSDLLVTSETSHVLEKQKIEHNVVNPPKQLWVTQSWKERLPTPALRLQPADNTDRRFHYRKDGFNEYRDALEIAIEMAEATSPEEHLLKVQMLFAQYYWAFKQMPVGSENSEICASLLGDNEKYLIFIPHESSAINAQGELLDYWGEPYYFHPVSEKKMEIRSRGEDKKLWTSDDITLQ